MWHCLRDFAFSHFDTILVCDRQTNRWTDKHMTIVNTVLAPHCSVFYRLDALHVMSDGLARRFVLEDHKPLEKGSG